MQEHYPTEIDKSYCLDIPADRVPILTGGKIYNANHPLHDEKFIYYTAMTPRQENILFSSAYVKDKTVIPKLLESSLIDKRIKVDNLIIADKDALLIALRISGYGSQYSVHITCPQCEAQNEHTCDLSKFEIERLKIEPITPFENKFSFTLPLSKYNVVFKMLTVKDNRELEIENQGNVSTINWLTKSVLSINGIEDKEQIRKAITNLRIKDSSALGTYIRSNEPKMKMVSDFTCSSCEYSEIFSLPKDYEFFGITLADKEALFLEPLFLLGYYFALTYRDYISLPVMNRKWLIKRIEDEIKKSQEKNGEPNARGSHLNTPEIRAMTNKTRTHVPSKLQRFT
jgi:hypothetical protein